MKQSKVISSMPEHPKKVLYIITKANWGGAQRYVYDLALATQAAGFDVAVAYGEDGEMTRRLVAEGVRVLSVTGLSRDIGLLSDIRAFYGLVRLFRSERPAIAHINSSKAGGLGCLAARLSGVPLVLFTAHGWAFNESRPRWQKSLIWVLSGMTVALSHETICVSEAARKDLRHFPFISRKMSVIHNGIDCSTLLPKEESRRTILPSHPEGFWIGMVSELHPTKRIQDAIDAMTIVAKEYPEAILVVIGEGSERSRLMQQIETSGLSERVFLPGFIPHASTLLGAFDIFLHTSQSEALGYAILEAGCGGLPVVAPRVGGIPEIITSDKHGLLVPPRNPRAIANALEFLMENPAHAKSIGATLQAHIRNQFSKELMVAATLDSYR